MPAPTGHRPSTAPPAGADAAAHPVLVGAAGSGSDASLTVGDVSETELLGLITPHLPSSPRQVVGNGDDCAVLAAPDGRYVVSTDVLVEGHHFRREWSTAYEVGRRAAAQNLADVAAMGAVPVALVVSLVLPPTTPLDWVVGLAEGMGSECAAACAGVVGGDLSAGEQVVIAVTVHGELGGREPVVRSGARPGDVVVLAGEPGMSAAGLALAQAGAAGDGTLEVVLDRQRGLGGVPAGTWAQESLTGDELAVRARGCLEVFRCPHPPLPAGPALAGAGASAMMDVSDSLLRDCSRLATASGVVIDLEVGGAALAEDAAWLVPVAGLVLDGGPRRGEDRPAGERAGREQAEALAREWVLTGGEDHGMLATVPAGTVLPEGCRVIGRVREPAGGGDGPQPGQVLVDGRPWTGGRGWDHFAAA